MKIPLRGMIEVNILGKMVPVYFVDDIPENPNWMGLSSYMDRRIMVRIKRQLDGMDTLIHELCHFHRMMAGTINHYPTDEEQVVNNTAGFVGALLRLNGLDIFAKLSMALDAACKNETTGFVYNIPGGDGFLDC